MPTTPPPHTIQHWHLTKPRARGTQGILASQAAAGAEAGAQMLRMGGTAADAAVAIAFTLAAMEPWNCSLGGTGFAQVMAPGGPAQTFDFGPVSPRHLDPAYPLTGRIAPNT